MQIPEIKTEVTNFRDKGEAVAISYRFSVESDSLSLTCDVHIGGAKDGSIQDIEDHAKRMLKSFLQRVADSIENTDE